MKKKLSLILISMVSIAIVTGCVENNTKAGEIRTNSKESVDGKYDVSILNNVIFFDGTWNNYPQIQYTKEEVTFIGDYFPHLREMLDWIKTNTNEDSVILCWWHYGHMIEGYAERNAIATSPSLSIVDTIELFTHIPEDAKLQIVEGMGSWTSNETIEELSKVLTTTNLSSNEIREITEKYDVNYILTQEYDTHIAWIFFDASGKNHEEYVVNDNYQEPTDKGKETLIFKMWSNYSEIQDLQLAYEHQPTDSLYDVRIFELI